MQNNQKIEVFLGSDHAGFALKEKIRKYLEKQKIPYHDLGSNKIVKSDDYPDYAFKVSKEVAKNQNNRGILICGTGAGMAIAANKVKGIRAVAAYDSYSAKMSRQHNNTNILGLRGRNFPYKKIEKIVSIWLSTPFSKEKRHKRRLKKIQNYESKN